jgi:hypothetical protein
MKQKFIFTSLFLTNQVNENFTRTITVSDDITFVGCYRPKNISTELMVQEFVNTMHHIYITLSLQFHGSQN